MKRNLFTGMFLIGAIALSSCSTMDKIAKSDDMGDDVYYTKAKAGDEYDYVAQYNQQQQVQAVRNDDYYYYGDYESRINRFGYYSPFAYQSDYYSYLPYSYYTPAVVYDYGYNPYYEFGVYSAFDFGYGSYGGYDNYGYGNAYSAYIYGGGSRRHGGGRGFSVWGNGGGGTGSFAPANSAYARSRYLANAPGANSGSGNGPAFVRANAAQGNSLYSNSRPGGSNAVYPGRPGTNSVANTGTINNNATNQPYVRPQSENPRPQVSQPIERPSVQATPASSSNSSGGGGSGSSSSSGGGGRPVRP